MMEECVEETSEASSGGARRRPMAVGGAGSEPGPEAGEPAPRARSAGDAARRGGVARPSPESGKPAALTHRPHLPHVPSAPLYSMHLVYADNRCLVYAYILLSMYNYCKYRPSPVHFTWPTHCYVCF